MRHLTMPRDDFIANVLLLGFGRSTLNDPGLQLIMRAAHPRGPIRVITILHSAKDCTIYLRYEIRPFQPPQMRQANIGNPKKFKYDNKAALEWLIPYIDKFRVDYGQG